MATLVELAYAAGIIDGEGCIGISQPRNRGFYSLNVEVAMTDPKPIKFFSDKFGGRFEIKKSKTSTGRTIYRWSLQSEKAQEFLRSISPFIVAKTEQVETALEFPVGSLNGIQLYGNGREIPESVLLLRELCFDKMKELKSPLGVI